MHRAATAVAISQRKNSWPSASGRATSIRTTGRAGRFERGDAGILRGVGRGGEAQIDEDAIGAVAIGRRQRLEIDRHDRLPVLAGRLGDQLLEPGAEVVDAGRGDRA